MKKSTMLLKIMVLIIILLIVASLFQNCSIKKQSEDGYEPIGLADVITSDEEILLKQEEQRQEKFANFKSSISNEIEIVVLTITDSMTIAHDNCTKANAVVKWLLKSEITLNVYYTAILSIPTESIKFIIGDTGNVEIIYNLDNLQVKSIQIDNIVTSTNRGVIGKSYNPSEVVALTLIATDYIEDSISNDAMLRFMAEQNLVNFIEAQSIKALLFNISIYEKKTVE